MADSRGMGGGAAAAAAGGIYGNTAGHGDIESHYEAVTWTRTPAGPHEFPRTTMKTGREELCSVPMASAPPADAVAAVVPQIVSKTPKDLVAGIKRKVVASTPTEVLVTIPAYNEDKERCMDSIHGICDSLERGLPAPTEDDPSDRALQAGGSPVNVQYQAAAAAAATDPVPGAQTSSPTNGTNPGAQAYSSATRYRDQLKASDVRVCMTFDGYEKIDDTVKKEMLTTDKYFSQHIIDPAYFDVKQRNGDGVHVFHKRVYVRKGENTLYPHVRLR